MALVYAVVLVISNASIWIQLGVLLPTLGVAFMKLQLARDENITPTESDRRYMLWAASAALGIGMLLGAMTIIIVYVAPNVPQVFPDHNLLGSWEMDFAALGMTRQEALERLNTGYVWHALLVFNYASLVLGGSMIVSVYRMGTSDKSKQQGQRPQATADQTATTESPHGETPSSVETPDPRNEESTLKRLIRLQVAYFARS